MLVEPISRECLRAGTITRRKQSMTRPIILGMASHPTISALPAADVPLAAGDAVAGRKLMGSAGLRQPAAHS